MVAHSGFGAPTPEEPAMFTRQFWTLTAERAVKTFAQALAAVLAASGVGLLSAHWKERCPRQAWRPSSRC